MNGEKQQDLRTQLAKLPEQIRKYYAIYFSELRKELSRPDLFSKAVPNYLRGYKRVVSIGGKDGLIVVHFPIELEINISQTDTGKLLVRFPSVSDAKEDAYEFITFPGSPVIDLISLVSDRQDISDVMPSETDWGIGVAGVFNKPVQQADLDTGQVTWQASWTRLAFADFNHLHFWEDTNRAKWEAKQDVKPYVRGLERAELDEVAAPDNVEKAGVKAGDRGVVIEVFQHPDPAVVVEYADPVGQTKALITYSTDLEKIFDVFVDRDFLEHREHSLEQDDVSQEQTHDFSSSSPVLKGLVSA
jgi:Domain of unknown function (DUF4926)